MMGYPLPADWNRADYPQPNCPHCGQFARRYRGDRCGHWVMGCGHNPETETP